MNPSNRQHLVLLGAGHAHLQVVQQWRDIAPQDTDVTLISPHPVQTYSGMMPGWVAGTYSIEDCQTDIRPWVAHAGIRWIQDTCVSLDANTKRLYVRGDSMQPIAFDQISIDIGSSMSLAQLERLIPGASGRVLPIRPMDQFVKYWEIAINMARNRPLDISIIGAGAAGVEIALACKAKLRQAKATASVSLLTGGADHLLRQFPKGVRKSALRALQDAGVTVLPHRCVRLEDGAIELENGLKLNCDLPIVAIGSMAPDWLAATGLALDPQGYISVNETHQSISHPHVFACGDIASRVDQSHAKSGVYAVRVGEHMGLQLATSLKDEPLQKIPLKRHTLNILNTANQRAIASYGPLSFSGWLAWRLKNYIDQKYIRSLRQAPTVTQD